MERYHMKFWGDRRIISDWDQRDVGLSSTGSCLVTGFSISIVELQDSVSALNTWNCRTWKCFVQGSHCPNWDLLILQILWTWTWNRLCEFCIICSPNTRIWVNWVIEKHSEDLNLPLLCLDMLQQNLFLNSRLCLNLYFLTCSTSAFRDNLFS
jgi:hypothetical protein